MTSRTSICPQCNVKVVHLPRVQGSDDSAMDLNKIQSFIEQLEESWGAVVNEEFMLESKDWTEGSPGL